MKTRKILPLLALLTLTLSLTAQAALNWNSTTYCAPTLKISGTTAACSAEVRAASGSTIEGTLTLYRTGAADVYVASWPVSGTTSVNVSGSHGVTRRQSYKLVLDVTVDGPNGVDEITKSATATCY